MLLLPVVLLQYAIRGKKKKKKSAKILFYEALGMHYDALRMHSKCVAFKGRPSKEALLCYTVNTPLKSLEAVGKTEGGDATDRP